MKRILLCLTVLCLFTGVGTSAIAKGMALGFEPAKAAGVMTRKPARKTGHPDQARSADVVDSTPKAQIQDRRE